MEYSFINVPKPPSKKRWMGKVPVVSAFVSHFGCLAAEKEKRNSSKVAHDQPMMQSKKKYKIVLAKGRPPHKAVN